MKKPASSYMRGDRTELCGCASCCKSVPGRAAVVARLRAELRSQFNRYVAPGLRNVQW